MNEREIAVSYQRDGYVAVEDIIKDRELAPIREFITGRVDDFAREEHAAGRLASRYEDESSAFAIPSISTKATKQLSVPRFDQA